MTDLVPDDLRLIDVHVHAPHAATLKVPWERWVPSFGSMGRSHAADVYDASGRLDAGRFDAYLDAEGVEVALLMSEYSPRVTGVQPIEDLLPLVEHNPRRFRLIANLNPHLHHPILDELERQLTLGAVAVKLHPVHGGFSPTHPELYLVYGRCAELGVPVVFHCGISTFPGALDRHGDPGPIGEVVHNVPGLAVVLAHGGRGWWYDAAAFLAQAHERVWIDLAGLPPQRLPTYYARHDLRRLARKFIFGSDWPGVPGIAQNARALVKVLTEAGSDASELRGALTGNARSVYRLDQDEEHAP